MTSEVLTRFCGPNWKEDPLLKPFAPLVERSFLKESQQHPLRVWEYTSALAARGFWMLYQSDQRGPFGALDVGGAGSPLWHMIHESPLWACTVVDQAAPAGWGIRLSAEDFAKSEPQAAAHAVFSISVLEHVEDLDQHLDALAALTLPGGLLFMTVDAWDPPVDAEHAKDTAHFHWMRKRIFNPKTVEHLMEALRLRGFNPFGGIDLVYKGNVCYDYTFCSVSMVKERS